MRPYYYGVQADMQQCYTKRLWCAAELFVYVSIVATGTEDTEPPTIKFLRAHDNGMLE